MVPKMVTTISDNANAKTPNRNDTHNTTNANTRIGKSAFNTSSLNTNQLITELREGYDRRRGTLFTALQTLGIPGYLPYIFILKDFMSSGYFFYSYRAHST